MKRLLLLTTIGLLFSFSALQAQNVFNPDDPIVRYSSSADVGSDENPDPSITGLQKWVSVPTNGVSTGSRSYDNSSYKAYYINVSIGNGNFQRMAFRLKFPKTYTTNPTGKFPAMLFFHGLGEAACPSNGGIYNNEKQLLHGARQFRDWVNSGLYDGFLIYPQLVADADCNANWSSNLNYMTVINSLIDSLVKHVRLNEDRLFVNGLSDGGAQVWRMATSHPRRVASIAPSAASTSNSFNSFVHIPIWFATGGRDSNPTPAAAAETLENGEDAGADIRYTLYPTLGHGVWEDHWDEPDYPGFMNRAHKANPLVFFQRNEFCPTDLINAKLGVTGGFLEYEWERTAPGSATGIVVARRQGGANTILDNSVVSLYTGNATTNEITVRTFGTYRVRFKRSATHDWSEWSPIPAVIGEKAATPTPPIQVSGLKSKVLPALDGSTTVPLTLPNGYDSYQWYSAGTETLLSTEQVLTAGVGQYKAKVSEEFGCSSIFSPVFYVADANGTPKPEGAKNLSGIPLSQTSIQLTWNQNPNAGSNETGFEIYRSLTPDGPYKLIHITAQNIVTYIDNGLISNTNYYYVVRAVNDFGAAAPSNEAVILTQLDKTPPSAPNNLQYRGSSQNSVSLQWNASTDNVGVLRYDIYVDDVKLYSSTELSATVYGLDALRTYALTVKAVDAAGNVSQPSNQVIAYTHNQGLNYKYYHGSWSVLPDFNTQTILKSGIAPTIDNGSTIRTRSDNYGLLWEGYIYIPVTGSYTFSTISDDGSKMYIDRSYSHTATALINNDGLHGNQTRSGTVTLSRGYHQIAVTYFERTSGDFMQLSWVSTAAGITQETIPQGYFSTQNFTIGAPPSTPGSLSATAASFNRINLSWTGGGSGVTGFEIQRSTSSGGTYIQLASVENGTNTFSDTSVNPSTTYYYKIRSTGVNGESALIGPANATTLSLGTPAAPSAIAAQLVGSNAVRLTFNDNSSNETGFEIWRSVNSNNTSNFKLLTIVPPHTGGQLVYNDTALYANITYYYRVRAKGLGNPSAYTSIVNARTTNTPPVMTNVLDFTMRYNTTFALPINALDPDGDVLSFQVINLPGFATVQNVSNGNANIIFSPRLPHKGTYSMRIIVSDGFTGFDTTFFRMEVNSNAVPTLSNISNVTLNEGATSNITVSANDMEGNSKLIWQTNGLPPFASFINGGNGQGTITLTPGYAHSGIYNATLLVDDGFGAWSSKTFSITVQDMEDAETIQIHMQDDGQSVALWNRVMIRRTSNFNHPNLINTLGVATAAGINSLGGGYSSSNDGLMTGGNTGVYPDRILRDNMTWGNANAADTVRLRIYGLNVNKKYNFTFFGNHGTFGSPSSVTTYIIGNKQTQSHFYQNTTERGFITDVSPNASGEVFITMAGDPATNVGGILNAIVIDALIDDGTVPVKPLNVVGEAITNLGVRLNWIDRAYNESNYQIFRSLNASGPYTHINPTGNFRDSSSYLDASVAPFTRYYYYLAGINGLGSGLPSDTVSVITGNNLPRITAVSNITVKSGATSSSEFAISDDPGEVLSLTISNKPDFVTLTNLGNNDYRVSASPTIDDIGFYSLNVIVSDDKGGEITRELQISVSDNFVRSVMVNVGKNNIPGPKPWNNWGEDGGNANDPLNNLLDDSNVPTTIDIRNLHKWAGAINELGHITGNNSGVYPDAVLSSGITTTSAAVLQMQFSGLDDTKLYNLIFLGSMQEGRNARLEVTVNGTTIRDTMDARYNTQETANLNGLTPNTGVIIVDIRKLDSAGYLNAIVIEEYAPAVSILNPSNLYVEPIDRTSVMISWSDRASNEDLSDGYQIQRATNASFSTGVVTMNIPGYITKDTITGLSQNTEYWFRVRAKSGSAFSTYSNVVNTITPQAIAYINFNFTVAPGPSPWNNLEFNPIVKEIFENIKDQSGNNTGLSFNIDSVFNGENNAGKRTGNNSGVVPDNVLASSFWIDNTQLSKVRISGLNHTKRYRFGFIGSSNWSATANMQFKNYTAMYTINDRTVYLNSWQNTTKIVYIGDVVPNENGEVILNFSTIGTAVYGFNSAVLIEAYDDEEGGTVPNQVFVNPDEESIVQDATIGQDMLEDRINISIYPNPFSDIVNLDFFNTSMTNNVSVEVFDITGRLTLRKQYGRLPKGFNTLRLNTNEGKIGPGVYLLTLSVNGKAVHAGKLIRK